MEYKTNEMKKLFAIAVIFLFACNNSGETTTSADSTGSSGGTENVNGNIPDTNSGLVLNQPLPVDSSNLKDSTKK